MTVFASHFDFDLNSAIDALDFISPNLPYKDWANIGRALAAEYGDDAFDDFDRWSSGGDNYREKEVRAQWKSFRRAQRVNISTLVYHARQAGWEPEKKQQLSEFEKAKLAKERQARKAARDEKAARITNQKLHRSEQFYNNLQPLTQNNKPAPYLVDKGLEDAAQHSEIRQYHSRTGRRNRHLLVIPHRDIEGNWQGAELIYAWRKSRDKKTGKLRHFRRAMTGTQPQLGFHVFPNHDALATAKRVYITEGWADGCWTHKAGEVSAYVIGCHNIPTIARQIKAKYPHIQVVAAPDNDKAGRETAFNAHTYWTMPLQDGDDWSDVATQQGLGSLRDQLSKIRGWNYIDVNERYLGHAEQAQIVPGLNLIRSAKETGKSTNIIKFLNDQPQLSVLVISYRKNLVNQLAQKAGVDYYEDLINIDQLGRFNNTELRKSRRLAISPDSLYKLLREGTVNPYGVIFVDECDQTLMHFDADTMKNREINFGVMSYLLTKSKYQVLADADLSELTQMYCNDIGLSSGQYVTNAYKPRQGSMMHLYKSALQLRDEMLQRIKTEPVFYCSNSKTRVLEMEQLLKAGGLAADKIQSVHSGNSSSVEIQRFMADINQQVKGLHVLLASPSMGTGISIDEGHQFKSVFAEFSHRSGTAEQAHQQMARVRGVSEYHVFVDPTFNNFETDSAELMRVMLDKPEHDANGLFTFDISKGEMVCKNLPFETHICRVRALVNDNRNSFAVRFLEQAESEGYTLATVEENPIIINAMKAEMKEIKLQINEETYSRLIDHEAHPILSDDDYLAAETGGITVSEESRLKTKVVKNLGLERALQLPSVINTEKVLDIVADLAYAELKSRFVSGIKKLSVCAQENDIAILRDIEDRKYAESRASLRHFTAQRRHELRFLRAVGIDENLNYNGKVFEPGKISQDLRQYIKRNREEIMAYSGSNITSKTLQNPVKWLMDHLRSLGVPMDKKQVRSAGGDRTWLYRVDADKWVDVKRLVNLRVRGLTRYYNGKKDELAKCVSQKPENVDTAPTNATPICHTRAIDYIDNNGSHVTNSHTAIPSPAPFTAQFEEKGRSQTPTPQFNNKFEEFIHQQTGPGATPPEKLKLAEKFPVSLQEQFNSGAIQTDDLMLWKEHGLSSAFRTAIFNVARVVAGKLDKTMRHQAVGICMDRLTGHHARDYCSGLLTRDKLTEIIFATELPGPQTST